MQSEATMKIVKYTGIFIAIIIVIWLSVAMYKRYITAKKNSPIFLKKPVHATKGKTIESKKIPVMVDGTEYTYSFWIFVNNWNYRNDKPKHVLHRGDSSCKNANPSVWLYPNTNKLMIRFQTYGEQGTDAQVDNSNLYPKYPMNTMNPIDDQSLMKGRNNYVCDINNIPLQRWVNVSIVLWNRTTDVYINGKLNRSCILAGVPKLNNGDVYVGHFGGFDGLVSKLRYYNKALDPNQIYETYLQGPYNNSFLNYKKYIPKIKDSVDMIESEFEKGYDKIKATFRESEDSDKDIKVPDQDNTIR